MTASPLRLGDLPAHWREYADRVDQDPMSDFEDAAMAYRARQCAKELDAALVTLLRRNCWWCKHTIEERGPFICNDEQTIHMCGVCVAQLGDFFEPQVTTVTLPRQMPDEEEELTRRDGTGASIPSSPPHPPTK